MDSTAIIRDNGAVFELFITGATGHGADAHAAFFAGIGCHWCFPRYLALLVTTAILIEFKL